MTSDMKINGFLFMIQVEKESQPVTHRNTRMTDYLDNIHVWTDLPSHTLLISNSVTDMRHGGEVVQPGGLEQTEQRQELNV